MLHVHWVEQMVCPTSEPLSPNSFPPITSQKLEKKTILSLIFFFSFTTIPLLLYANSWPH